eukprot:768156-Hanusia_phi.AAC.7
MLLVEQLPAQAAEWRRADAAEIGMCGPPTICKTGLTHRGGVWSVSPQCRRIPARSVNTKLQIGHCRESNP